MHVKSKENSNLSAILDNFQIHISLFFLSNCVMWCDKAEEILGEILISPNLERQVWEWYMQKKNKYPLRATPLQVIFPPSV